MIRSAAVHCLRRLAQLSGRDSRSQFWPYAGCVIGALVGVYQLFIVAWMAPRILRRDQPAEPAAIFDAMVALSAAVAIFFVAALGAAVVRRLHDTDHRGTWGLLPLPLLTSGIYGMQRLAEQLDDTSRLDPAPFILLFINNMAYIATVGLLIWKLSRPGSIGENRYGPPPTPSSISPN